MKLKCLKLSLCLVLAVFSGFVQAHGRWIVPSHTVLSGDTPEYVVFDISISNEIFKPDYALGGYPEEKINNIDAKPRKAPQAIKVVMDSSRLQVLKPDGSKQSDYAIVDFHRKSSVAAKLDLSGTYRINLVQNPTYVTWFNDVDDSLHRLFGKAIDLKGLLPKGAKNIRTTKLVNTIETYITRNDISFTALKTKGEGIEVKYSSHPNELFVGETFRFKVLSNGKPINSVVSAHLIRQNTRYRNDREDILLKQDKSGEVSVKWQKPGLYLLEMKFEQDSMEPGVESETLSSYIVYEVFPE